MTCIMYVIITDYHCTSISLFRCSPPDDDIPLPRDTRDYRPKAFGPHLLSASGNDTNEQRITMGILQKIEDIESASMMLLLNLQVTC